MTTIRSKLETILERLDARAADERVFVRLYHEAARAAADAADARRHAGVSLSPLDGAIVSIKDLFDVAGETTLAGSIALRDRPPATRDAAIVRRLRQAGAVILGKTNMVEFAYSGLGLNPHYGTPGNAADPLRIPGGSVRIPAALNGVVGFKPTAHRVPLDGAFPLSPSLDSIGPLARSVQDCAVADAIMAGEEPWTLKPGSLSGLRIGLPRGRLFADTEPLVEQAFERALSRLSQAGAKVADHGIEDLLTAMAETTAAASIASIEASEVHADWLETKAAEIDPRVRWSIARSGTVPAPLYIRMIRHRQALVAAMDERLSPVDVLALPTTAVSAPLIAPLEADDRLYNKTDWHILRNPMFCNQFDLTAISLPVTGCERPVGFMLVARHGQDRRLLEIAAGVERALAG